MEIETTTQLTTPASSHAETPAAPPAPPPEPTAPAEAKGPKASDLPPEALAARLEREREAERKRVLAELGVENVDSGKAALEAYRKAQREQLSEVERLRIEREELAKKASQADQLTAIVKLQADAALSAISEQQRAAVQRMAGDDPAKQLQVLTSLREGGFLTVATSGAVPAPATTAPPPSAPSTVTPPNPDRLSAYESLLARNPMAAAKYMALHGGEIMAERAQRSG